MFFWLRESLKKNVKTPLIWHFSIFGHYETEKKMQGQQQQQQGQQQQKQQQQEEQQEQHEQEEEEQQQHAQKCDKKMCGKMVTNCGMKRTSH